MTKGQEQITSALAHIAGVAGEGSLGAGVQERLDSVRGDLEGLLEATFVKSALCVPFTAACDRAAKALAETAGSDGDIDAETAKLEKATKNVKDKSTGAGGMIIT
ncbi:MAG: hypothetical protein QF422_10295 [Dehalococcoidia bacterium]|jgi:hypothetical protein|nr:hypothetical protein [Dehalococcoidia bacterium]